MGLYKKELYLYMMVLSTIVFGVCMIVSSKSTMVMSHDHCNTTPEFAILPFSEVLNKVKKSIQEAKYHITTSLNSPSPNHFEKNLLQSYKIANSNGVHIKFILSNQGAFASYLEGQNFTDISQINGVSNLPEFDCIIIDEEFYIIPGFFLFSDEKIAVQMVHAYGCPPVVDDVKAFFNFFLDRFGAENKAKRPYYSQKFISKSSAIRPTIINNESVFMFQSSTVDMPMRICADMVMEAAFSNNPKEVYLYSHSIPALDSYPDNAKKAASIYYQLTATAMTNKTKIHILTEHKNQELYRSAMLLAYPSVDLKLFDQSDDRIGFMVVDDEAFAFSTPMNVYQGNKISLHMRWKSKRVVDYMIKYFNDAYVQANSLNISWGKI